jgi:hypothetical protein
MICDNVFYLVRFVGLKYRHNALLEQVGHHKFCWFEIQTQCFAGTARAPQVSQTENIFPQILYCPTNAHKLN